MDRIDGCYEVLWKDVKRVQTLIKEGKLMGGFQGIVEQMTSILSERQHESGATSQQIPKIIRDLLERLISVRRSRKGEKDLYYES
ncbi:MAG TPA: hypothetical protein DDX81_03795 [Desulfofustis sp.]|nr:hypothetical protein [Desulfofustis sp.]